jgi:hypothetical protein
MIQSEIVNGILNDQIVDHATVAKLAIAQSSMDSYVSCGSAVITDQMIARNVTARQPTAIAR